jgi:1,4-alpha-glucan branching enzyme
VGNGGQELLTEDHHWMNRPQSLVVTLPPLAAIVLKRAAEPAADESLSPPAEADEGPASTAEP